MEGRTASLPRVTVCTVSHQRHHCTPQGGCTAGLVSAVGYRMGFMCRHTHTHTHTHAHTHTNTCKKESQLVHTQTTLTCTQRHHTHKPKCTHHHCAPSLSPLQLWHAGEEATNSLPHHGVFAHKDNAPATHGFADVLHLTRAHIVCSNNEHTIVRLKSLLRREVGRRRNIKQHNDNTHGCTD